MKKNMDAIQFESRAEIADLMKVIDNYIKQKPAEKQNRTLERFFDLLDVMLMEWWAVKPFYNKIEAFREYISGCFLFGKNGG